MLWCANKISLTPFKTKVLIPSAAGNVDSWWLTVESSLLRVALSWRQLQPQHHPPSWGQSTSHDWSVHRIAEGCKTARGGQKGPLAPVYNDCAGTTPSFRGSHGISWTTAVTASQLSNSFSFICFPSFPFNGWPEECSPINFLNANLCHRAYFPGNLTLRVLKENPMFIN